MSPAERYIKAKEAEIEKKSLEIALNKEVLRSLMDRIDQASLVVGKTGQRCSNCHQRNHTVRSCKGDKCELPFLCGALSKHPTEKIVFDEKKRTIGVLEVAVKRHKQELTSRQTAFYRVNNSVNKNVEDILIEEYPEEYVVDGIRYWLKIQRDVSLVKKTVRNSNDITREKIRSILEGKYNNKLIPELSDSLFPTKPKTPMQAKLESYGVNFPSKKTLVLANQLMPNTEDEEIEQLRMVTKLSLAAPTDINNELFEVEACEPVPFDYAGYTDLQQDEPVCHETKNKDTDKEVANILLDLMNYKNSDEQ